MKSFKDLDRDELYRAALEDFAVDIEEDASADDIRAEFVAVGISWADYVAQHPELQEDEKEEKASGVVKSGDVTGKKNKAKTGNVRVAEPVVRPEGDDYLIKMTRENTLYETRGYKFTQEHPYALVSAEDADYILSREDGFRQAFPSELAEFYG